MPWINLVLSALIVGLGQPAWFPWLAPIAAAAGYALCWHTLLGISSSKRRFWTGSLWFFGVQLFQLSWLLSHPFHYIYIVYTGLAFLMGLQHGLLALLITRERMETWRGPLLLAGVWTIQEWLRLYFLSGFTFNPVGLALAATLPSVQAAALFGVFGLSFWVILTNGYLLHAYLEGGKLWRGWATLALLPYFYGAGVLTLDKPHEPTASLSVLLVDTTFPPEELQTRELAEFVSLSEKEWQMIFKALVEHKEKNVDLIALPEGVVPLGSRHPFYDHKILKETVALELGEEIANALPQPSPPYGKEIYTSAGNRWLVSNGYWAHAIATLLEADVVAGLEGEYTDEHGSYATNAALLYRHGLIAGKWGYAESYAKRVLFPFAEAIPHPWLQPLAKKYGVGGGFLPGKKAGIMECNGIKIGVSVCYDETFSHLMRENKTAGAKVLLNLSNDVWYPHSKLATQHYDLGRLRSIELGLPALRSCNYGISGVIDCRGRLLTAFDGNEYSDWTVRVLAADLPVRTAKTLYTLWGDNAILLFSLFCLALCLQGKSRCTSI